MTAFEESSFFDDELKSLSNAVVTVFGAPALDEAMTRATNAFRATLDPDAPVSVALLPCYDGHQSRISTAPDAALADVSDGLVVSARRRPGGTCDRERRRARAVRRRP
jgi:hypothetical protein